MTIIYLQRVDGIIDQHKWINTTHNVPRCPLYFGREALLLSSISSGVGKRQETPEFVLKPKEKRALHYFTLPDRDTFLFAAPLPGGSSVSEIIRDPENVTPCRSQQLEVVTLEVQVTVTRWHWWEPDGETSRSKKKLCKPTVWFLNEIKERFLCVSLTSEALNARWAWRGMKMNKVILSRVFSQVQLSFWGQFSGRAMSVTSIQIHLEGDMRAQFEDLKTYWKIKLARVCELLSPVRDTEQTCFGR